MLLGEAAEPTDQPFRGEIGRCADRKSAALLTPHQPLGADGDAIERIADDGQVIAASFGEGQSLSFAVEKLQSERVFERFDLVTDRALRDVQFLGGSGAVERWQSATHLMAKP